MSNKKQEGIEGHIPVANPLDYVESVEEEEAIGACRENLNSLGREGWELVGVISQPDPKSGISDHYMILKRLITVT